MIAGRIILLIRSWSRSHCHPASEAKREGGNQAHHRVILNSLGPFLMLAIARIRRMQRAKPPDNFIAIR